MSDEAMLDAYRDAQAWAAELILKMGGDPAKPTQEQAEAVARALIERAMTMQAMFDPDGPTPTAREIIQDYRKLERMQKRRTQ